MYVGTENGIFLSENNGVNWVSVNNGLPAAGYFDMNDVGVYDSGTPYDLPGDYVEINALVISDHKLFASTTRYGIYCSIDNGNNWTPCNMNGLTNVHVSTLAISGNNLLAGTDKGLFEASIDQLYQTNSGFRK